MAFDYGTASWGLDTGDFNDDGYPDLVVCAATEGDPNFTDPGHIYIKLNDGSEKCFNSSSPGILVASLPPPIELTYTLGSTPFGSIAVLDYNRDGLLDIVFAGDWSMIMYIQQGNFTFKLFLACMFRDMKLTWADHLHEGGFAVGDFNQDGFEDLVVGGVMGTVRLLINNKTYVCISKPEDRSTYFFGKRVYPGFPFPSLKMVIGWVNVEVTFIKNLSISRVDFYLDGNLVYSDSAKPFEWKWKRFGFGKYLLAVEAFDEKGNFLGRDTAIVWKFL
ncbi:MAG: VCBS repeat-containing protein [Thermoplasmata archaeon]|nr:VCBS repeat-containing protein [Thermoplasmata archaeon]